MHLQTHSKKQTKTRSDILGGLEGKPFLVLKMMSIVLSLGSALTVCVCVYAHKYIHPHECVCIHMNECVQMSVYCTCICENMSVCAHEYVYVQMCMCTCVCGNMSVCAHEYPHV